jgi:outer membrane immunogenic protein
VRNAVLFGSAILAIAAIAPARTASAADVNARPYASETFVVPGYNWSGVYIGGNIGYGWGRSSDSAGLSPGGPPVFTDTLRSTMNGIVGGGQIGYNSQMQNWLWGLEADFQGTGQSSSHSFTCPTGVCTAATALLPFLPPTIPGAAVAITARKQLDFFGTVRGRLGILVVPTVLIYATGGLAYGQVDTNSSLAGAARAQNYNPGYVIGGGVEAAIGGDWTAKLEYLYLDLGTVSGSFNSTVTAIGGAGSLTENFSSRITDSIVRVGLNYKFTGPEISKY